jgi:AcrR family transcriptional regulator
MVLDTPSRTWQEKRRESAREEILAAAWAAVREHGLGTITLRDIAERVGMRAPSLYWHFPSKMALYDAMFGQAWRSYLQVQTDLETRLRTSPRHALKMHGQAFFDFCVTDPVRHQLMNQRSIPGFAPSPEAYAPAVEVLEQLRRLLARLGVVDEAGADLYTALLSGLIDQQLANDPGGDRWARLLDRAVDMYATEMNLPDDDPDPHDDTRLHTDRHLEEET